MTYTLKTSDNAGLYIENGHPVFVTDPATPAEFWPVDDTIPDDHHRTGWELVNGVCTATTAPNVPNRRARLASRIAARRWEVETGGVVVNGTPIATDRQSQFNFLASYLLTPDGATLNWKGVDGEFSLVPKSALGPIVQAVFGHVQAQFNREDVLKDKLAATADADLIAFEATVEQFLPNA
jgi:hypothetical protein